MMSSHVYKHVFYNIVNVASLSVQTLSLYRSGRDKHVHRCIVWFSWFCSILNKLDNGSFVIRIKSAGFKVALDNLLAAMSNS